MRRLSQEELEGKLQAFPDTYENFMGEPLDFNVLKGYLIEQLNNKKRQFIDQAFSTLSAADIKTMLAHIQKQLEPKPESPSPKIEPKKQRKQNVN